MASDARPAVVETHAATLFFYRDRVLKVRHPVAHGTLDDRSVEQRRVHCEREVALNRGLAPDVYLGTAVVTVDGAPAEHAVVMRRLARGRSLGAVLRRTRDGTADIQALAAALARFHAGADRSPRIDAAATGAALWQRWQAVEEPMSRFVGQTVDAARYRELTVLARRYLEGRGPLFDQRIAEGAVCDGHGDLSVADVFVLDDGPRILDRLALDDEGRYADVLADVASLVQDLELAGAHRAVDALLAAYGRSSGRAHPASLLHFYVAQRAHVRLLFRSLSAEQGLRGGPAPAVLVDQALAHLQAALPRLVLVGGRRPADRSTVATWVSAQLAAEVLVAVPAPGGPGPSSVERLCAQAGPLLGTGRSVVLDATWAAAKDRMAAAQEARRWSAELVALRCTSDDDERTPPEGEAPMDPWPEALVVDTSAGVDTSADADTSPGAVTPAGLDTSAAGEGGAPRTAPQPGTTTVPTRPARRSCARPNGPMAARPPVAST